MVSSCAFFVCLLFIVIRGPENIVDCKMQLKFTHTHTLNRMYNLTSQQQKRTRDIALAAIQYSILDNIFCSALHSEIMKEKKWRHAAETAAVLYYLYPFGDVHHRSISCSPIRSSPVLALVQRVFSLPVLILPLWPVRLLNGYLIGFWASSSFRCATLHCIFPFPIS